jgi:hypothetical protein
VGVIAHYLREGGLIEEDELSAWADEQRELGGSGEFYFACVQCCFSGARRA